MIPSARRRRNRGLGGGGGAGEMLLQATFTEPNGTAVGYEAETGQIIQIANGTAEILGNKIHTVDPDTIAVFDVVANGIFHLLGVVSSGQGWLIWRFTDLNSYFLAYTGGPGTEVFQIFRRNVTNTLIGTKAAIWSDPVDKILTLDGNNMTVNIGGTSLTVVDAFNATATKHGITGAFGGDAEEMRMFPL